MIVSECMIRYGVLVIDDDRKAALAEFQTAVNESRHCEVWKQVGNNEKGELIATSGT